MGKCQAMHGVHFHVHRDILLDAIRRRAKQNISEFQIICRIGKIERAKGVTRLSIAADDNHRDGDKWKTGPLWGRVNMFGKLRDLLARADKDVSILISGRG
jgi:hypothetical protein